MSLTEVAITGAGIMDLSYTKPYLDFQADVRAFLGEHWDPERARDKVAGGDYVRAFRREATARGYLYRSIPRVYGGSEQKPDVLAAQIIREEFDRARAPREISDIGMMMLVPTLLEVGEDWQKEMFIEKTVLGDYQWAQGYSEPGAGSDLASLKTRAVLDGNEWVINGHKIWTTRAYTATHMFCLCRTEPEAPKHAGISYILLDFRNKGVTVRPLKQISGATDFCEVFLEDVRTPAEWIVGRRGEGWAVSRVNLKHERNAVGGAANSVELFRKLIRLAQNATRNGRPLIDDPVIRDRIIALEGYVLSHLYSGYYQQTLAARGEEAGVLGLMNKLNTTEIGKEVAQIAGDILGERGLQAPVHKKGVRPGDEKWFNQIMGSLGLAIAGGTSNIQRNIIAERGLALPRDLIET